MSERMPLRYLASEFFRRLVCGCAGHSWQLRFASDARYCPRCHTLQPLTGPVRGHPESMSAHLDRASEAWLAWVEAELFPKETH
ncbi:hypothetical protein [uncultured Thermomonospora sp.]|uniref:hypothetical protein n=1 Tax=uncultured Thermomonospora sp. TaxID=671175 RepID=UPI00259B7F16|nr:hypothetical protein [uncultured Thermomonospora sp.]